MRSERPLTGSLQIKNDKYYAVINEYVGDVRKPDWVYTGYRAVPGSKLKARGFLQKELLRRTEERRRPSRLKDASADMPFVDFMRLWLKMKKKGVTPSTYQGYEFIINGHINDFFTAHGISLSSLSAEECRRLLRFTV